MAASHFAESDVQINVQTEQRSEAKHTKSGTKERCSTETVETLKTAPACYEWVVCFLCFCLKNFLDLNLHQAVIR